MKAAPLWRRIAAAALLLASGAAFAGQACEEKAPDARSIELGMTLAQHVAQRLDASGAEVVLLARAGQDLHRYGLRYSHLAFAYREPDGSGASPAPAAPIPGVWRIAHKLNQCGTAEAGVFRQGLGEFFMDDPFRYEAAFVVLAPEVQARLLPLLQDNRRLVQWHTAAYSVVAYPWSQRYQQSNQWALETLAGALEPAAATRRQAQAWLQLHDYQPTVLNIDAFTRLGARMTKANVAFDDHPNAKRFSDHIETVTVESIFAWIPRAQLGSAPTVVY